MGKIYSIKNFASLSLVLFLITVGNLKVFAGGYLSSAATQASTAGVNASETNRQIIRVSVTATTGAGSCGVSQLQFTMQNTNNADVANAKLFYTGTTSTFDPGAPGTQQGATINNPTGTITFACTVSGLSNTTVYFWLTFDIASSPTICNTLDAFVPANGLTITGTGSGTKTPTTPDPSGNRAIVGVGCQDYCTPTGNLNCTVNDFISNVTINTLNNTSTCGSGGYTRYTGGGAETTSLSAGGLYTISLSVGAGTGTHGAGVWIDFDNDGVFTDANEFFLISNSISPSTTVSSTISIPTTATANTTRMRVRYAYNLTVASTMSCTMGGTYGETEDYTVTILAYTAHCTNSTQDGGETSVDCGGTDCAPYGIVSMSPVSPASVTCGSGSFTLTASNVLGTSIQWQYSPDNVIWYDMGGATNLTYSGTAYNAISYFRAKITGDNCSDYTTSSLSIAVTGKTTYYWKTSGATTSYTTNTNWWTTPGGPANPASAPSAACDDVVIQASDAIPTITANTNCGDLTISSGTLILSGADINVYGNFVNNGTYQDGIGYSTFLKGTGNTWSGTGTYTRSGGGDGGNMVIDDGANYVLLNDIGPLYVPNVQTTLPSLTCYSRTGHLNLQTYTMIVSGVWCATSNYHFGTGVVDLRGGGSVDPGKTDYQNGTLWINSSTSNFTFDLEDDYYNVWFSNSAGATKFGGSAVNVSITNDNWIKSGTLDNSQAGTNTIFVGGDWINDASYIASTATINLNGSAEQEIKGSSSTTFNKLTINNSSSTGVVVQTTANVSSTLTLTDGNLYTSTTAGTDPYIRIQNGASVSPVGGSASSYVDGYIRKTGYSSGTEFIFPTGDNGNWRRISVTPNTTTATGEFEAIYLNSAYTNTTAIETAAPDNLNHVSTLEHWYLTRTVAGTDGAVKLYWEDASASGINDCATAPPTGDLCVARWDGTKWQNENFSGSSGGAISGSCGTSGSVTSRNYVSSFSPFTFSSKSAVVNPLPVELLSFTAYPVKDMVQLNWSTANEINNDYFTIERSKDAESWEAIASVDGAGNSNRQIDYLSYDNKPYTGTSFYRLRQTDYDGQYKYFNVVAVELKRKNETSIDIYPNPASRGTVFVETNGYAAGEKVHCSLRNTLGQSVYSENLVIEKESENIIPFSVEKFPVGIYFFEITSDKQYHIQKLVLK